MGHRVIEQVVCLEGSLGGRLSDIYAACFSGAPWFEEWTREAASQELQSLLAKGADIVAVECDGEIASIGVGVSVEVAGDAAQLIALGIDRGSYYIAEIATDPAYQRRGLCTEICMILEERARAAGATSLSARTRFDNIGAISVFERLTMQKIAGYSAETGGRTSLRVVFQKRF